MKKFLALIALLFALTVPQCGCAEILYGTVKEAIDGDTIKVELASGAVETVRYLLIDTPELHHPKRGEEELGKEAYLANRALVQGRRVALELDQVNRDRYGRLLAYVWLERASGRELANAVLVERGLALPYVFPPNERYLPLIREAASRAQHRERGLWGRAKWRVFTPEQIWAELPHLAGYFITLEMEPEEITHSGSRYLLVQGKRRSVAVIYKDNLHLFPPLQEFNGCPLRMVGKVTAGHRGAELVLNDPLQVVVVQKSVRWALWR